MSKIIIPLAVATIAFAVYILVKLFSTQYPQTRTIYIKNRIYYLETATNPIQQMKGLSGRSSLCQNCGMLFVFPVDTILPFWMKDTLIPLDIIWLDSSGSVVKIISAPTQPGSSINQLTTYTNERPAKYVIELNIGESNKIGLHVGDTINL